MNNKKSGTKTLLMSVVMSAPGPLIIGLGLLVGKSSTQIADFVRRSAELLGIIMAYIVYKITAKDGACDADKKERMERLSNIFVGAMMCLGGSLMLWIAFTADNAEKGNVIPGLIIALLGVVANTIFWIKYRNLNKAEENAIIAVQARLYGAKSLVDSCVSIALLSVVLFPGTEISFYLDFIGSVVVAVYLIWCGIKTIAEKVKGFCKNPIIKSMYTADPAPMVFGDTLYLYTSHDEEELKNDFYTMRNWHCFSTKNMVNWKDHGEIFSLEDISWADDRAWAPQAIERNGKFYLYCPVHKKDGGMAIAVGVSDSPAGPFKDLGFPLVDEGDWNDIDPTVFIDDDGQAYLYFGNPQLRYVLLNEDMISYDKTVGVVNIPMTEESFAKGSHTTGTSYAEGPWFYKRNGIYYMVYAAFGEGKKDEHLAYSTSHSPIGPWTYGGVLMTEEGGVFTNHPGVVDFKGHSYLFYHTGELPGGSLFHRSVCVAEFTYNADGSIDTIAKCDGVKAI